MSLTFQTGTKLKNIAKIQGGKYNGKTISLNTKLDEIDETDFKRLRIPNNWVFQLLPDKTASRQIIYITGASGSGKSTFTRKFVKEYKKIWKDRDVYLFSALKEDESLDEIKPKRFRIDESLISIPLDIERWIVENGVKVHENETIYVTIPQGIDDNEIIILRDNIINNVINSLFILGKHKLYSIACEGALKIKEVTYIHCEGFSAGSLKHGPFALLDNSNLTLLLIDYNDIANYANIKSTYYEILGRETNLFVITNSQNVIDELQIDDNKYILLYKLDYYNEVIFTIVLQKLAYEISIAKGLNPDKPRNLAKVVTVE